MRAYALAIIACLAPASADARDLFKTLAEPPSKVWESTNHADFKFCVITSIAAKTGQASTVVDKGTDTIIIVHNWSSPVPGDDVRAIFTIKSNGTMEFRGQKTDLQTEVEHCAKM